MENSLTAGNDYPAGAKYYFILGSNPALSIAEIAAVLPHGHNDISLAGGDNSVLVFDGVAIENSRDLISRLGGTVKIGKISTEISDYDTKKILAAATNFIGQGTGSGKFNFGFSYYGKRKINIKVLGMEFKKILSAKGINSRWVTSREPVLSSVVVGQNRLVANGLEICLIQNGEKLLIGKTEAVQPFKDLSYRDYGRPARDDRSGMLPPKLAQIMINLALPSFQRQEKNGRAAILDPFCGSGTILTEAMLMGHANLTGSDISAKAVEDTEKNIGWIIKTYGLKSKNYKLYNRAAAEISAIMGPDSVNAIITEPYLGPQRGRIAFNDTKAGLEKLYSDSLAEFKKILKPDGRIVMVWPVFRAMAGEEKIMPALNGYQIINPMPAKLLEGRAVKLTARNTIIYGRPGQKIWREIVILKNQK